MIIRLLERNTGIRDIEQVLQISRKCTLSTLLRYGNSIQIKPARKRYYSVQIDEVWSFVGKRKRGKYGLFYAYSAEYD
uniref:hypothetical protein n=1 Tax=Adhaeribacter radiodurans TaxID=2745197 RepID=UPI001FE26684|nr:hypothetical protein [Adhaeribacter radiodurans]